MGQQGFKEVNLDCLWSYNFSDPREALEHSFLVYKFRLNARNLINATLDRKFYCNCHIEQGGAGDLENKVFWNKYIFITLVLL